MIGFLHVTAHRVRPVVLLGPWGSNLELDFDLLLVLIDATFRLAVTLETYDKLSDGASYNSTFEASTI